MKQLIDKGLQEEEVLLVCCCDFKIGLDISDVTVHCAIVYSCLPRLVCSVRTGTWSHPTTAMCRCPGRETGVTIA